MGGSVVHLRDEKITYPGGATRSADAEDDAYDMIPPGPLRRLARRYGQGAKAHGPRNWESGMPADVVYRHLMRHLELYRSGDRSDDHMAAVAWGAFALMHYEEARPSGFVPFGNDLGSAK